MTSPGEDLSYYDILFEAMPKRRTVAPISLEYPDENSCLESPVEFDEGVFVGPSPSWKLNEGDFALLLPFHEIVDSERARFAFAAEYDAEEGDVDPRLASPVPKPVELAAVIRIEWVNIALWLTRPTSIGFRATIHQVKDDGAFRNFGRQFAPFSPVVARPSYAHDSLRQGDLEIARDLYVAIRDLERDGSIWVSTYMLLRALRSDDWVVRFLILWTAIEAIFGTEGGGEVTYRLAERVALLLEDNLAERTRRFDQIRKTDYDLRSKAVHGLRILKDRKPEDLEAALLRAEEIIRSSLRKILLDPKLRTVLNGDGRDDYLAKLALS